jgi:2-hydroxy-3-keto-5-methylthiopentenyl-1-phosphate phosphatase
MEAAAPRDVNAPGSILVDFDGTACLHDVAEHLLIRYGDPSWPTWDEAWARGEVGARQGLDAQAAMLDASTYALDHCPLDPTFAPFVDWARSIGAPVTLVSDGFGFYILPLLHARGLVDIPVITNDWGGGAMTFPNGHDVCIGCGTCKMRAVLEAPGPVAFVGEGDSDRFGALYADIVFAKDALVDWCERDGVPFVPWKDFDDVRRRLEAGLPLPGAVAPERCPGWRLP